MSRQKHKAAAPPSRKVDQKAFQKGVTAHQAGQLKAAEAFYRQALILQPSSPSVLANLGALLRQTGRLGEAINVLKRAVEIAPQNINALTNISNCYRDMGNLAEAVSAGRKAASLPERDTNVLNSYGFALWCDNQFEEAQIALQGALSLDGTNYHAWNNLGNVHQRLCRIDDAIACYRRALEVNPSMAVAYSNLLFCMHFSPKFSPDEIAAEHRAWAKLFEAPKLPTVPAFKRSDLPDVPLRIGMVSADFRSHPVMDFLKPLIRNWPTEKFSLYCYSNHASIDDTTLWLKGRCTGWRDVIGVSDTDLVSQIRADKIDILFDLTGHTGNNRLLAFAYKPAPVQVSWLGYFDTTGMSSIDFIIADPVCVRPGEAARYSERVVSLPNDFVCYEPPVFAPDVEQLPALANGRTITFGSQNQIVKITEGVIALWARVLKEIPHSQLLLAGKGFNDESTMKSFKEKFVSSGVAPNRLIFKKGNTKIGVLQTYNEIDIALDPFPCAGGTTTCEALWMGVPVVSLYGERFGGRHSASHLSAVGLSQLVAKSHDEYVAICQRLVADLDSLGRLRRSLRTNMSASPLCNGALFAKNFEHAIEIMWKAKLQSLP